MRTIPCSEPSELTAGDSWQWDLALDDYAPSDGWALTYALSGATRLDVGGTSVLVAGDGWQIRIPAADTAPLAPGTYRFAAYVTKDGDRFEVRRGTITVRADLSSISDGRSHAEKALPIIEAALEGRLTQDMESFQINGRAVSRIAITELRRLRVQYRNELWQIRNPGRLGPRIRVRFGGSL